MALRVLVLLLVTVSISAQAQGNKIASTARLLLPADSLIIAGPDAVPSLAAFDSSPSPVEPANVPVVMISPPAIDAPPAEDSVTAVRSPPAVAGNPAPDPSLNGRAARPVGLLALCRFTPAGTPYAPSQSNCHLCRCRACPCTTGKSSEWALDLPAFYPRHSFECNCQL